MKDVEFISLIQYLMWDPMDIRIIAKEIKRKSNPKVFQIYIIIGEGLTTTSLTCYLTVTMINLSLEISVLRQLCVQLGKLYNLLHF